MDEDVEYLSPGFDASSLIVPRLRAILVSHDIEYKASAKKADLVQIFNEQLVPRSRKILAARARIKRTSRGIEDMPSSQEGTADGEEDAGLRPPPEATRRKAKRASPRESTAATEETAPTVIPSKKQPAVRKSVDKRPHSPDDEIDAGGEGLRPMARRTRHSLTPAMKDDEPEPSKTRPTLQHSVFSDDNPFQSGSSPSVATESRRRSAVTSTEKRKSDARRRRTEGVSSDVARVKREDGIVVPSSRTFHVPVSHLKEEVPIKEEFHDEIEAGEEFTPEEQLELVRARAAAGEVDLLPPRRKRRPKKSSGVLKTAPWVVLMTLFTGYAAWWRREKLEIGYCGLGKPAMDLAEYQIPAFLSALQPQCEPCPQHAYCYADLEARCEPDFVLTAHPFSLGGLVPLPPTCEPDGEKARKVKVVADRAIEELRERRAQFECGTLIDEKGQDVKTVEIEADQLKAEISQKRRKGMSQREFESLWEGALGEITGREEVSSDTRGSYTSIYLSSSSLARLPLSCAFRRSVRNTLARYRIELVGLILILSAIATARNRLLAVRSDTAKVPSLVSTTLDRLATQAALYAQQSAPEPWISVGQMRDDVLRDEFSASRREAIWKRVKAIVEMNTNVRPSVKESRSGDVSRVWEWIGNVGFLEDSLAGDRRRSGRYSLGPAGTPDGRASPEKEGNGEMVQPRKWDEGRPIY